MRRPITDIGRGEALAGAAIVLTVALFVVELRFLNEWGSGIHLAYLGIASLAILAIALGEPSEGDPSPTLSVLYVTSFLLALRALYHLAEVLGADNGLNQWETLTWVGAVLTLLGGFLAWTRRSAVMMLFAAVAFGVMVESAYEWVVDPQGPEGLRWILMALIAIYAVGILLIRDERPRHAIALADAAGLALVVLAISLIGDSTGPIFGLVLGQAQLSGIPGGWEIAQLLGGGLLVAYGIYERAPGPAYFGGYSLVAFTVLARVGEEVSMLWWPVILLVVALIAAAYEFSPARAASGEPSGSAPT